MTVDEALTEWHTKRRRMGCVAAANWFCKRVPGFKPLRRSSYTEEGYLYQHVVASNGRVIIDLSPYADGPKQDQALPKTTRLAPWT